MKSKDHHIVSHIILILACITIIYPFCVIIGASFQSPADLAEHGYRMIPKEFSLEAYKMIFQTSGQLLNSYKVTLIVTLLGTILATTLTTSYAYVISRPTYRYRKILSFYVFFTMLFNGGLVANYLWLSGTLNLKNTYAVLILPLCVSPWNIIMMKGFMMGLPSSLPEAAKVDGATKLQLIRHIDLPLIMPTATILLIMNCGSILSVGFEKAFLLQNNLNASVSEIISTYVYKVGLINNDMSYSSAIGLFNTIVNMVMLIIVNTISDKLSGNSLW